MSELNPYQASTDSQPAEPDVTTTQQLVARAIEYAISIMIVLALVWVVNAFVIS